MRDELFRKLIPDFSLPNQNLLKIEHHQLLLGIPVSLTLPKDQLVYVDDHNLIAFAGIIYNLECLTEQFQLEGATAAAQLWHLYLLKGQNFISYLQGDFTICIATKNELWLFRDQLGVMPLAYYQQKDVCAFSSDVWQLCAATHPKEEPIIWDALLDGVKYTDPLLCPNPLVKRLPGGSRIDLLSGQPAVRWWFPERISTQKGRDFDHIQQHFNYELNRAVKQRLGNIQHIAVHLSGGLDSGVVAAIAKQQIHEKQQVEAYSWSPHQLENDQLEFDERELVQKCAIHLQIPLHFQQVSNAELSVLNSRYFANASSPEEEWILNHAAKKGVQLLLSGWGGDDVVSMHDPALEADMIRELKWLKLVFNRKNKKTRRKLGQLYKKVLLPMLGKLPKPTIDYLEFQLTYLHPDYKFHDKKSLSNTFFFKNRRDKHIRNLLNGHLSLRCEMHYLLGLRYGIRYAYPLLDVELIEFFLSLPTNALWNEHEDRHLMRAFARKVLPQSVAAHQRKTDPALNAFSYQLYGNLGQQIFNYFLDHPPLQEINCINFEQISRDYKKEASPENQEVLLCALYNLYTLHLFYSQYRKV